MHGIFLSAFVNSSFLDASFNRPLGPYRMASFLRNNNYDIQVIEFAHLLTDDQIYRLVEKFITPETKFIGLGLMIYYKHGKWIQCINKFARVMTSLKEKYPHVKIIVGGSTGFIWSKRYPNKSVFDYIIKGYGEDQTLALFDHYYKGTPHPAFEIVDGNKHISEHLVKNKVFQFTADSHKWHTRDCIQPSEVLPIEFARGCIFKCSFCRYPHIGKHKNDYTKHLDCIKEEILYNYNNFGTTSYYVTDDTFNADTEFVKQFTDMVKSLPFALKYAAFIRADLIHGNPETEDMFLENGLMSCQFGIETFDTTDSKIIGKAWSAKHGKKYLPYLYNDKWKNKIHICVGMLAGLPNETLSDLKNTNKWFIDNNIPSWLWHALHIAKDSNYYKSDFDLKAEEYGFKFKLFEGRPIWYHDNCDELLAFDWKNELTNESKQYQTVPTWTLMELESYQYDKHHSISASVAKVTDLNVDFINKTATTMIKKYYQDLWDL
jgi:radical SAM superfamily enzyme YgiQ (UPF0313 family)